MKRHNGTYAIIQYSPVPERLEFLNIGILLIVEGLGYVGVRFAKGQSRIERLFGKQSKLYLDAVKASFESRVLQDFSRNMDKEHLATFSKKRANGMRLSPFMAVAVEEAEVVLDELFRDLVGEDEPAKREPRIRRKLREYFSKNGVEHYLQAPDPIELPEYGIRIDVPFGYQNGCYNLIDGMRLPEAPGESLREAGKRAMEGALIWKHFGSLENRKRLVIVGDFAKQSQEFYGAIKGQFEDSNVKLYRLDDLAPLVADIKENGELHSA